MKIGYCLIKSPFKYRVSYLNDSLKYQTPSDKSVSFYGFVNGKKGPSEIKITIPVDDSGAGKANFDWALEVANAFDNIVTNNPQYTLTDDTLITNYQNHVLNNADYKTYWANSIKDNKNLKNANKSFQAGTFLKIRNSFFNYVASADCPITAGDCLLHYLRRGKKKPQNMTPQSFYTCFQKALRVVKLLDRCYEKDLNDDKAKIIFFYSFPKDHIQDYVRHGQRNFDNDTIEDLNNFF